jgi:hypothetical protein
MKSVKVISISLNKDLIEIGREAARIDGFEFSFSSWVAHLIRKEIQCRGSIGQSRLALSPSCLDRAKNEPKTLDMAPSPRISPT